MKRSMAARLAAALLCAAVLTALAASGALDTADATLYDGLYQSPQQTTACSGRDKLINCGLQFLDHKCDLPLFW